MTKKLIRFDWAVKKLLRNKANFVVLEGFLSELLFDDIKIQKILESESNQDTENDKYNRVDILTQNSKNELIIVEIQNTYEIDFFHRMIYGTSKALIENISLGQTYSEIKKVISAVSSIILVNCSRLKNQLKDFEIVSEENALIVLKKK